MRTDDEPRDPDSREDEIEADRRTVEEHLRAVMRDIRLAPAGTTEASQLNEEARRLRDERGRLTNEAGRIERGAPNLPRAVADIERERDRRRIGLQILAVVVPWRDALPDMDAEECDLFWLRAHALLNYLDVAVMPYPDLQGALAAARSELGPERPNTEPQRLH